MNKEALSEFRLTVQSFIKVFGLLEQSATPCGVPLSVSQVYAMQELENISMSVSDLAQRLNLERSTVSRLVDSLVKENLVNRVINEANRREMILTLTEKGSRTIQQVREQSLRFFQDVLGDLQESDQATIIDGFKKFTNALLQYRRKQND
ncbi:MarR family transcriptional regulator [Paenibacillus sp. P26]|nr:MarR family transcriptional regulator [Paenibacillus sp. P26]UUZ92678.1 MarR family transcriptional regulator [Paenibacillus sp. P25]